MKKLFLLICLILVGLNSANAFGEQEIRMQIIKGGPAHSGNTKSPDIPLVLTQDDNILTLPATPVDYTLVLYDENGTVTYSTLLPAGTTQVILPTTLSGTYEIRLVAETYYYIGYIEL